MSHLTRARQCWDTVNALRGPLLAVTNDECCCGDRATCMVSAPRVCPYNSIGSPVFVVFKAVGVVHEHCALSEHDDR